MRNWDSNMKNRGCTPHLFALLVLSIFLLIMAKFFFSGLPDVPQLQFLITPTVSPVPESKRARVFILPQKTSVLAGQMFDLQLVIDSGEHQLTLIDLALNYDKDKLSFEIASPSSFFTDQVTFANVIDNDKGSIRLALGSLIPVSGSGTLFSLSGTVLPTASGSAAVLFSGQSRAGAVGSAESVLGKTEGSELTIVSF